MLYQGPRYILPIIILSQFAGTSLWFVGNAILPDVQQQIHLAKETTGQITSSVQFGFIAGTLLFALLAIADRFSPSKVFFVSSIIAALFNLSVLWINENFYLLLLCRFFTGFFLAGIYPIGMKIASDWFEKGLGNALGYLVGALVLGTALPHLLKGFSYDVSWEMIVAFTSLFAFAGGLLIFLFVKDGPYRKQSSSFKIKNISRIFKTKDFSAAAFGYFGHMWELYTFWAFVPLILQMYNQINNEKIPVSLWSFFIIGIGFLSCIAGGKLSKKWGSKKVAFYSLLVSGICCLISPFIFFFNLSFFLFLLLIWGSAVIADSPQFSTLVAQTVPIENKGTALTIVTSIGFAITIISIQLLQYFKSYLNEYVFWLLVPGPLIGVLFFRKMKLKNQ
ncbi:MAG TPA: MFS transporter [Chitinophagaceae bacterium]|nr:MFS transporter [Chitinophagaceae bacterium]